MCLLLTSVPYVVTLVVSAISMGVPSLEYRRLMRFGCTGARHAILPVKREKNMKSVLAVILASLAIFSSSAIAHSGGTDRNGFHTDHSTGMRHCH